MFNKLFLFLTGFGLMVIGCTYIIMYLNLFTLGYTLIDYLLFLLTHIECLFTFIGLLLIIISTHKGDKKNDIYL